MHNCHGILKCLQMSVCVCVCVCVCGRERGSPHVNNTNCSELCTQCTKSALKTATQLTVMHAELGTCNCLVKYLRYVSDNAIHCMCMINTFLVIISLVCSLLSSKVNTCSTVSSQSLRFCSVSLLSRVTAGPDAVPGGRMSHQCIFQHQIYIYPITHKDLTNTGNTGGWFPDHIFLMWIVNSITLLLFLHAIKNIFKNSLHLHVLLSRGLRR